jgi:hypothetical protein
VGKGVRARRLLKVEPSAEVAVDKPYEITFSMRRGTANWITDTLIDSKAARDYYGEGRTKDLARGLILSPTRARLKVPCDQGLLKSIRSMFWNILPHAPYNVAVALERLVKEIDAVLDTSIVDHLVKYMDKLGTV